MAFPSEQNTMWDANPKFSYRFPLIVHYLEGRRRWAVGRATWNKTCSMAI